jgi:transcriptional regulator with XRE-family HTH domain
MKSPTSTGQRGSRSRSRNFKANRLPPGVPNPVDIHVGSRVRLRRTLLGMSQERLGEAVNLTFQQIQKYERGANRIGASRLFELSRVLDVPVSFFFEDMPDDIKTPEGVKARALQDRGQEPFEPAPLPRRETLELVRAYYRIADPKIRKRLFELTKSLSGAAPEE